MSEVIKELRKIAAEEAHRKERDRIAELAMVGLCANSIPGSHNRPENIVRGAYELADAMLSARKEPSHD